MGVHGGLCRFAPPPERALVAPPGRIALLGMDAALGMDAPHCDEAQTEDGQERGE